MAPELTSPPRAIALGVNLLVVFFVFGVVMSLLAAFMVMFPGSLLEPMWRLNPEARQSLMSMRPWTVPLMAAVAVGCLLAAHGLAARAEWGRRLAIAILVVNLAGDTIAAVIRADPRTLIGLPIAGAMILFLMSNGARRLFSSADGG